MLVLHGINTPARIHPLSPHLPAEPDPIPPEGVIMEADHGPGDSEAEDEGSWSDTESLDHFGVDALCNSIPQNTMIGNGSMGLQSEIQQIELDESFTSTPATHSTATSQLPAEENDKRRKLNEATTADSRRFQDLATKNDDKDLQAWSKVFAEFYRIYESGAAQSSAGKAASHHGIAIANLETGKFAPTLVDILELLPSQYQIHATVVDIAGIPDQNKSWLDDNMMGLVILLSHRLHSRPSTTVSFGQGIATGLDEAFNELYLRDYSKDYLEYILQQGTESDATQFIFPPTTKTIVIPWNFTGNHWVIINVNIIPEGWKYTMYNSFDNGGRKIGGSWNSMVNQMPLLEKVICLLSGIPAPSGPSSFHLGESAKQENSHDCGIISISNALALLHGREPEIDGLNADALRLKYANLLLENLQAQLRTRDTSASHLDSTSVSDSGIETQGLLRIPSQGTAASGSNEKHLIPQSEGAVNKQALFSNLEYPTKPPRRPQRQRNEIQRFTEASSHKQSPLEIQIAALPRNEQAWFSVLQQPLSRKTVETLLLDSSNNAHLVLPECRISIILHDILVMSVGSTKTQRKQLLEEYLQAPEVPLTASVRDENELAEEESPDPPQLVFAPCSVQDGWIMIMFMITPSSCRAEVYDPAGCLGEKATWDGVKNVLEKIFNAVYEEDSDAFFRSSIQKPEVKDKSTCKLSSGVKIVRYANSWIKECHEAIAGSRCFYSSSTPLSTEPSPLSQPNEDSQPLTQSQKNLHRRVVSAQDPKDRALYMIYVDTELGQQARAITDKKARDQFIVAHGTLTGRLPKHAQFFSPVATPRGSDEGQTEEGDLATPNDTATTSSTG